MKIKGEGKKSTHEDFLKNINGMDVVCLQETKGPVKVANYKCYNSNRKNSRSGGVCICIKKELIGGIKRIDNAKHDDCVAVKFMKKYFKIPKDIVLINAYDSPKNSSYKMSNQGILEDSVLDAVSNLIEKTNEGSQIIVLGDFNARIGNLSDNMVQHFNPQNDFNNVNQDEQENTLMRSSKDSKLNPNGKPFIEFVTTNGLNILNGRTIGDIFGDYTCIQYNGSSVVDYVCVSMNATKYVHSFNVGRLSYISDHRPVYMNMGLDSLERFAVLSNPHVYEQAPLGYCWIPGTDNSAASFKRAQSKDEITQEIKEMHDMNVNNADDIMHLNKKLINVYSSISKISLRAKKPFKRSNLKKWFDWDCRRLKRELRSAERKFEKNLEDLNARENYYQKRKEYRKTKAKKKSEFLHRINEQIEEGKSLNWKAFKNLKEQHTDPIAFDDYDLNSFYCFFKELYKRKCNNLNHNPPYATSVTPPIISEDEYLILNQPITLEELAATIKKLKANKSPSLDLIINEMLKHSTHELQLILLRLFNECLLLGVYPWNMSVTTPLHKTGDREEPDNYRGITIGSCLGKLFSTILLARLVLFRSKVCPDTPNQLGFCAGSQTSDHILVLKTVIDKYVKKNKLRVYSCFVDYKKAFDSVCRQALMMKLTNIGVRGNFFNCLQDMYSKSTSKIKLIQKLSDAIDIEIGTEQGHPLSPELFKIFIQDLSTQLNQLATSSPLLNDLEITHLLWADDLVLLALDGKSLQNQLDCLNSYVLNWELDVNLKKTNVMIFNTSGRILKESYNFKLGNVSIDPVKEYCYLGVVFCINGSFKHAVNNLVAAAKRSFHHIKKIIDPRSLSVKSLLNLFDMLILPVISYGSQVWLPYTSAGKAIERGLDVTSMYIKDAFELFHTRYIKWVLGLHKLASNLACYGDTGRVPIAVDLVKQNIKYFRKLEAKSTNETCSFVSNAFIEQKNLQLEWFNVWHSVSVTAATPTACKENQYNAFVTAWNVKRGTQNKLAFYNSVKEQFGFEQYLYTPDINARKALSRIRTSAHDLRIETGRYEQKHENTNAVKACRFCCDIPTLSTLGHLPESVDYIVEDEGHVISTCPYYHHLRIALSDKLKDQIMQRNFSLIMSDYNLTKELGLYLHKCFKLRNTTHSAKKLT